MNCEWKTVKLGDIGRIVGGATPSTKDLENYNGNIAWITPKDLSVFHGRYISCGERNITKKGLKSCSAQILPKNSVLFSSRAPIGYIAIAANELCTNQGFKSIIPNSNTDYLFLYYLLRYNKDKIESMGSGTTFKEVSGATMKNIEVAVPDLETQKKIAKVLSALDDKIEQNNAINHNLEQQAKEYFKQMFIDNVGCGWKLGTINDLGKVVGGSTPSKKNPKYYTKNGIAWITPKDLSINKNKFISHGENDITQLGLINSSVVIMPAGTVLFSSRAPIGYVAIASGKLTTNQGFKSIIPKPNIGTAYVYYFLKNNLSVIESMSSGSTFKEISGSAMKKVPAIIPDDISLDKFDKFCTPIFLQQEILEEQNQALVILRNTLLPKLMSGELDVSEVEI